MQTTKLIKFGKDGKARFENWSAYDSLTKDFNPEKSAKRLIGGKGYREMNNKKA